MVIWYLNSRGDTSLFLDTLLPYLSWMAGLLVAEWSIEIKIVKLSLDMAPGPPTSYFFPKVAWVETGPPILLKCRIGWSRLDRDIWHACSRTRQSGLLAGGHLSGPVLLMTIRHLLKMRISRRHEEQGVIMTLAQTNCRPFNLNRRERSQTTIFEVRLIYLDTLVNIFQYLGSDMIPRVLMAE